jgi:hypothetical protein
MASIMFVVIHFLRGQMYVNAECGVPGLRNEIRRKEVSVAERLSVEILSFLSFRIPHSEIRNQDIPQPRHSAIKNIPKSALRRLAFSRKGV